MNARLFALLLGLTLGLMAETVYIPWVRSRGEDIPLGPAIVRLLRLWLLYVPVMVIVMVVMSPPHAVVPLDSDLANFVVFTLPLLVVANLFRLVAAWRRQHFAR